MNQTKIERSPQLAYKSGYKYKLQEPYWIQTPLRPDKYIGFNGWISLDTSGKMMIMPGYAWDGPSGGAPDLPCTMAGSLVHDAGCQLIEEGLLPESDKPVLDQFMAEIMHADGLWSQCAQLFHWAVSTFGWFFIHTPQKVHVLKTKTTQSTNKEIIKP